MTAVATLANPPAADDNLLATIDGQTYDLPQSDLGWETVRFSTTDDQTVLLMSVNDSADVAIGMTSTGQMVNAAEAEWLPGNGDLMLSGDWSAPDTLHITAQPFLPPGGFQVWLTFDSEGVVDVRTFGK